MKKRVKREVATFRKVGLNRSTFSAEQKMLIRYALRRGFNPSFMRSGISTMSAFQVLMAYRLKGVDVRKYVKPGHSYTQISQLVNMVKWRIDPTPVLAPIWSSGLMELYYIGKLNGYDITEYITPDYSSEQASQVFEALAEDLDVSELNDISKTPEEMEEIRNRLQEENGLEITTLGEMKLNQLLMSLI